MIAAKANKNNCLLQCCMILFLQHCGCVFPYTGTIHPEKHLLKPIFHTPDILKKGDKLWNFAEQ